MRECLSARALPILLSCTLLSTAFAAEPKDSNTGGETNRTSKNFEPVSPGVLDGRIAYVSARILEQVQMLKHPFDDAYSGRLLDEYIEALDPQRLHFLQADITEFEKYRTRLDNLTVTSRYVADTRPAAEIFNRYMERLKQRVDYGQEILKTEKFSFDADERILVNRKEAAYPKNLDEAKKLWSERLRYEYLQEKLGAIDAKKKKETAKNNDGSTNSVPTDKKESATPAKSPHQEIVDTLSKRYNRTLRTFVDWDMQDVLQIYLRTLAQVYDPHSDYMGKEQLESFAIGMNLSLFGIGAELQSDDGYCTIRRLMPNGPAEKSKKIKVNDRIIAVAQGDAEPVDVVEMTLSKAVQLIRGPKGTEVRLTVSPADDPSARRLVTLVREEIKLEDQEAKAKIIDMPQSQGGTVRIGVIDLPSFYATFDPAHVRENADPKSTTSDVAKLLKKLKQENVAGVVLDLRRNGGGSLEEAIRLTGLFIKEGPVVQIRDMENNIEEDSDTDPAVAYGGPLLVLTSRFSASASEILAGALQDYGRALVVGDSATHGKGTVQTVQDLTPYMRAGGLNLTNNPGAIKITIKKFYRPSGASTQLRGVTPDIVLPSIFNESKEIGENAFDNPLPWDTINSAKFEKLDMVSPFIADLRRTSQDRIAQDKDFNYIREDISYFKKMQADKTVSLNEKVRIREKNEIVARQKARDKERLARPEPAEKAYEITLKLAETPGLPEPMKHTNTVARAESEITPEDLLAHASGDEVNPGGSAEEEVKPAPVDPTMDETKRILVDYLGLLKRGNIASKALSATSSGKN